MNQNTATVVCACQTKGVLCISEIKHLCRIRARIFLVLILTSDLISDKIFAENRGKYITVKLISDGTFGF